MRWLAPIILVALAALAQLALGSLPDVDTRGVPPLCVVVLASWAAVRGSAEVWPALLVAAPLLGAASDERVGWFLLALLPVPAAAMAFGPREGARAALTALALGFAGAACYLAVLALGAGRPALLADDVGALAPSLAGTALAATVVAGALYPFRRRRSGLFE